MKAITLYINEALVTSKPTGTFIKPKYKYYPQSKEELVRNIKTELEAGNMDLNCIDTSEIKDMSYLFSNGAGTYNQEIDFTEYPNIDISGWDVSNVEDMYYMFYRYVNFNCDISKWDVSNVRNMRATFFACTTFNQDISKWDVSNVEDMTYMFAFTHSFMCVGIENWNVSNIKSVSDMFQGAPLSRLYGREPKIKNGKFVKK